MFIIYGFCCFRVFNVNNLIFQIVYRIFCQFLRSNSAFFSGFFLWFLFLPLWSFSLSFPICSDNIKSCQTVFSRSNLFFNSFLPLFSFRIFLFVLIDSFSEISLFLLHFLSLIFDYWYHLTCRNLLSHLSFHYLQFWSQTLNLFTSAF